MLKFSCAIYNNTVKGEWKCNMKNKAFIDLSHTIENGLITYKGLPAPIICDYLSREESRKHYEKGTEFQIGKIEMVSNTGTYVDVPFHRYPDGKDLSETTIDKMAGLEGIIVHVDENNKEIDEELFYDLDIEGKAVLIHTGWDKYWNTDQYFENHPYPELFITLITPLIECSALKGLTKKDSSPKR
jgi:arylformamidase